jgi:hypothetical protein
MTVEKHDLGDAMERGYDCMENDGGNEVELQGENPPQGWKGLWRWLELMLY